MSELPLSFVLRFDIKTLSSIWENSGTSDGTREYITNNLGLFCEKYNIPITRTFGEFLSAYHWKRYREDYPEKKDQQKLLIYISTGELELVKIALSKEPKLISFAIYQAVLHNQTEVLKYLNTVDDYLNYIDAIPALPTVISCAVDTKNMKLLVEYLTDDLLKNNFDDILSLAVQAKWEEGIFFLLSKGEITSWNKIFEEACNEGNLELVKYCVGRSKERNLNVGLNYSAKSKNLELCKYLVSVGADVVSGCMSRASEANWMEGVLFFIELGDSSYKQSYIETVHNYDFICVDFLHRVLH